MIKISANRKISKDQLGLQRTQDILHFKHISCIARVKYKLKLNTTANKLSRTIRFSQFEKCSSSYAGKKQIIYVFQLKSVGVFKSIIEYLSEKY